MPGSRRNFLALAGAVAVAYALPGWRWRRSPAADPGPGSGGDDGARLRDGAAALERASRRGRPLLVIVVPEDATERWRRGNLFGVYVNRVEGNAAAELALCDLWCATRQELATLVPRASVEEATLALLVETDGSAARPIAGGLPDDLETWGEEWLDEGKRVAAVKARLDALAELLHAALAPDAATLARRRDAEVARLAATPAVAALLADDVAPTAEHARFAPAWTLARAHAAAPEQRAAWQALLEREVARRWRDEPPPRARWSKDDGCGGSTEWITADPELEQGSVPGVACGMGYTPEYSARFLTFFLDRA